MNPQTATKIVGLTGGIASGKTQVTQLFAEKNVPIIDADEIARRVVARGSQGLSQIVAHFGEDLLLDSGDLNRSQLRERIFSHEPDRLWLNALLHPLIEQATQQDIQKHQQALYVIWAVPLLIETQLHQKVDRVLLVDCPVELQRQRLMQRDHIDRTLANAMIAAQLDRKTRLNNADDVIQNHHDLADLKHQVGALHAFYCRLFGASYI